MSSSGGDVPSAARRAYWREATWRSRHGGSDPAALLAEQEGCCYLCGKPLSPGTRNAINVDHDHSHCPPGRSCPACRRGLTCNRCNSAVGLLGDDPGLMRRIADNLEAAQRATRARIAAAPVQMTLE